MKLFTPIVRFFRHLKNSEKFSAIGIILGIPIIVLTLILILILNNKIKLTYQQSLGANYHTKLQHLYENIQQYHDNFLSSEKNKQLISSFDNVSIDIQDLLAYDHKIDSSTLVTKQIKTLDKLWQFYHPEHKDNYLTNDTHLYRKIKKQLLDLIEVIAHEYELILSLDKFNHYLSRDAVVYLPKILHDLDEIKINCSLEDCSTIQLENHKIIYLIPSIKSSLKGLERSKLFMNLGDHNGKYGNKSPELSNHQEVIDELDIFVNNIEEDLFEKDPSIIKNITEEASRLIDMSFTLYESKVNQLAKAIDKQLKNLKLIKGLMIGFQVIAFLLTVYCFYGFYLSIRYSLKEIDEERQAVKSRYTETQRQLKAVEKKMTQKVMQAHEKERKSIVKDLHDTIGQSLYSIIIKLQVAMDFIKPEGKENLQEIIDISDLAMKEIRRISQRLRPEILDHLGFIPALKSFITHYKKTYNLQVAFHYPNIYERVDEETETQLYRICQEALTNIAKHAEATNVTLCLNVTAKNIYLKIKDNGKGFSAESYRQAAEQQTLGLYSMRERAQSLGGTFHIESSQGKGTTIKVIVPKNSSNKIDE